MHEVPPLLRPMHAATPYWPGACTAATTEADACSAAITEPDAPSTHYYQALASKALNKNNKKTTINILC